MIFFLKRRVMGYLFFEKKEKRKKRATISLQEHAEASNKDKISHDAIWSTILKNGIFL